MTEQERKTLILAIRMLRRKLPKSDIVTLSGDEIDIDCGGEVMDDEMIIFMDVCKRYKLMIYILPVNKSVVVTIHIP